MIFFQINPKVLKDFLEILHRQSWRVQETFFYVKIPRLVASFNSFCNFFQRRIAIAFMDANPYLVFLVFNLVTRKPKQILLKLFYSSLIISFIIEGRKNRFRLTHFRPMFPFYIHWKRQKTEGYLTFSGGIETEHWPKMG